MHEEFASSYSARTSQPSSQHYGLEGLRSQPRQTQQLPVTLGRVGTMAPTETIGAVESEGAFVAQYDRERRIALLRVMAPAFIIISTLAIVLLSPYAVFAAQNRRLLVTVDAVLALVIVVDSVALVAMRRGQITFASVLVLIASAISAVTVEVAWVNANHLDLFGIVGFAALGAVIVEAGALGELWLIVGTTVIMNAVSLGILLLAPPAADLTGVLHREFVIVAPMTLLLQWVVGATMIALWRNFQATLRQMSIAYERARQLDELKSQFIASVNHELRTPLTTMNTYIQASLQGWDRLAPQEIRSALEHADRVGRSLADLVKEILSTRRIDQEASAFTPAPVQVRTTLQEAVALVDMRTESEQPRDLILNVPEDVVIWGDVTRLRQVFTNLLSNALKYSPSGSSIEVEARHVASVANTQEGTGTRRRFLRGQTQAQLSAVEIVVRDHGLGIPTQQIPFLFNRFVRLPRDLASTIVGTGLGLYLCRLYIEAMGGRIWVESSGIQGEGSSFYIRLPIPSTSQHEADSRSLAGSAAR